MYFNDWLSNNYIEIFGAITGILYVILEIRQNIWLWPLGIITSAVYIWVFLTGKLYADMSLQGYYLVISIMGWYWWVKGSGRRAQGAGRRAQSAGQSSIVSPLEGGSGGVYPSTETKKYERTKTAKLPSLEGMGVGKVELEKLTVSRLKLNTGRILTIIFIFLFLAMWIILDRLTDSPVPAWDSFITSLSIIATWMLARKIFEHWYLWIVVNIAASILFFTRELYPTVILYVVYCAMSFVGLIEWKKSLNKNNGLN
ncbi:MAG: nicotinamide riboside transporter PnuC [Bacteroidales bacterium]|jgi:nicotinamide mononucleotide transporter|nr:nicotinamide riboside transporter PnuC [Bacteroidales bacterium]